MLKAGTESPRSFSAAIGKKHAVHAGEFAKLLGEEALIFVVVQVRNVNQAGSLLADGFHDARMCVSESVDAEARDEIEVFLALKIKKKNALAALEGDWIAIVGLQQVLALALNEFL